MVFVSSEYKRANDSKITSAHAKLHLYGLRYNFDLKPKACQNRSNLQKLEATIICEHVTGE